MELQNSTLVPVIHMPGHTKRDGDSLGVIDLDLVLTYDSDDLRNTVES